METILALIVGGGVEAGKMLLMAYLENQRIQGKTKEEIEAHMIEVATEFYASGDPLLILTELQRTISAQQAPK
jgi:hypothetical protein